MYARINKNGQIVLISDGLMSDIDAEGLLNNIKVDDTVEIGDYFNKKTKKFSKYKTLADKKNADFKGKIRELGNFISQYIDNECKKLLYFNGLGFANGLSSVAKYPNNSDAKKLSNWAGRIWKRASELHNDILAKKIDVNTLDLNAELSKIKL